MKLARVLIVIIISAALQHELKAQTCGFGCLGLSGFYAGYTIDNYDLTGLNERLNQSLLFNGIQNENVNFTKMKGVRLGANIFRAKFHDYFITAKGFYQFSKDEFSTSNKSSDGSPLSKSNYEMNHWGLGFDFGIPLFNFLSWKILEGGVKFFKAELTNQILNENSKYEDEKYETVDVEIGYYVGTGIIIQIIENYINIEGTAVYNLMRINDLYDSNGEVYLIGNSKIVEKGGISATIQLNIGVPL